MTVVTNSKINAIVSSDALSGHTKEAVNAEVNNYKVPMITNLEDCLIELSSEFNKAIGSFRSTVKETSSSAVIDTSAVSALKSSVSNASSEVSDLSSTFRGIYSRINDIVGVSNPSTSGIKHHFSAAKRVMTQTNEGMTAFNGQSNPYSGIAGRLAKQKVVVGKLTSALSGGYAHIDKQSYLFSTKYAKSSKKFDDKVKSMIVKKTPALALVANGMNAAMLNDLAKMCGQIKTGKGLFGKYKKWSKPFGDLYLVAALTKDKDGRIGFKSTAQMIRQYQLRTGKKVPKAVIKLLKHIDRNLVIKTLTDNFTKTPTLKKDLRVFIDAKGEITANGKGMAKRLYLLNAHKLVDPTYKGGLALKSHFKSAIKSAGDAISPIKLLKDIKKAKGMGKAVPILNTVSSAVGAVDGINASEKLANQAHLKGGKRFASLTGGAGIDLGTTAAIAGTSDLVANVMADATLGAASLLGVAVTAPEWATVAAVAAVGTGVAFGINYITDKYKLNNKLKGAWNNVLANN